MGITLFRAARDAWTGLGACYAEAVEDAEAYAVEGLGRGGNRLHEVRLADDARVLDLDEDEGRREILAAYGDVVEDVDDDGNVLDARRELPARFDRDHSYQVVEEDRSRLAARGWTHIRYEDDYPEGCITVQRIAPGADEAVFLRVVEPPADADDDDDGWPW